MKNATKAFVSTFGAIMALAGIEHGIGEILQGNVAPEGIMILSWPGSEFFRIQAGEPAMTILPNLLITGILAVFFSLIFLFWTTLFVQRKNSGRVMLLLAIAMLLFGGGIFPPIFCVVISALATKINSSLPWWRAHLPVHFRIFLGKLWPLFFSMCVITWLFMLAGINSLDYFLGIQNDNLMYALMISAFGLFFLTMLTGFAHDSLKADPTTGLRFSLARKPTST